MSKKALLLICDGWGIGDRGKDDVIYNTPTPYWDELLKTYPNSQLQASGENVGLPDGQMGNSEVGHLNIGAGRIVYQDLVKINIACRQNTILDNPEIKRAYSYAKENGKQIHFMGLVSDGGVHHWNTCSSWRISPKNTESTKHMFIALWTVATRTREVVKALSNSWKTTCKQQAERSLPSSAVTMQWTVTNVGNA